jgi:CTP:molybdopterin cytidylyltransferase MocA
MSPAMLPAECYDELLRLRGDIGARPVLFDRRRLPPMEVENLRAGFDLDYPHDVEVSRRASTWPSQP